MRNVGIQTGQPNERPSIFFKDNTSVGLGINAVDVTANNALSNGNIANSIDVSLMNYPEPYVRQSFCPAICIEKHQKSRELSRQGS